MVRLALDGQEKVRIAHLLGVAKSTVETWVYRYRAGGLDALVPIKQPGAAPRLDPSQHERLRARLDADATDADGVWHWIKSHHTSNRTFADYNHLLDAVGAAWRSPLRFTCPSPPSGWTGDLHPPKVEHARHT